MKVMGLICKRLSLKAKLIAIIGLVSIMSLACLLAMLIYTQNKILRNSLLDEVRIISENMTGSLAAALIFEDTLMVEDILKTAFTKQQILYVEIDLEEKASLDYYSKSGGGRSYPRSANEVLLKTGYHFGESLELLQPLQYKDEDLGQLYMQVDLQPIRRTLLRYTLIGLFGLVGSTLFGLILALRLQKVISSPVIQLTEAMTSVSGDQDYSRRIANDRTDEMGSLIDNFNHMLSQIEQRDEKLSSQRQYLDHLAYHDFLTGLPNRLLFRDRLSTALSRSSRADKKIGLLFLDLDRFKNINDTLGHDVGDLVLKQVTRRLQQKIRSQDTLARLGGDEFVMIVEDIQEPRALSLVAEKVQQELAKPLLIEGHELFISTSIGITLFPDDAPTVEGLMKCADVAMYRAKAAGRNTYRFFTNGMNEEVEEALFLENNMRKALQNDEFILYYQPQLDLHSGAIYGMEALIRWQHPTQGLVSPARFVPVAEESSLILSIGSWVLKKACAQARTWHEQGFPLCKVAVNISSRQFSQGDLCAIVAAALEEAKLDPVFLELEITESAIMHDMDRAIQTMDELVALGVSLSIDDFGTGHSSLSYLERFPISSLKIDRSFLAKIQPGGKNGVLAEAIIGLAKTLHLDVVAEGIETEFQKWFLTSHGCRFGQGYYLSRPIPAPECEAFFTRLSALAQFVALPRYGNYRSVQKDAEDLRLPFMNL